MPKRPRLKKLTKKVREKVKEKVSKAVAVIREQPPAPEILDLVRDPAVEPAKLKALLDMQNEQRRATSAQAYAVAMSDAQAGMEPVRKDCENRQTHSRYASYAALDRAIRKHYVENGFSLEYNTEDTPEADKVRMTCDVSHKAGYSKRFTLPMPVVTKGPQGRDVMTATHATMSAVTYGKRGLLKMIFNIAEFSEDDDGNAAGAVPISEADLKKLRLEIAEADADEAKVCEFAKINTLEEMPALMLGKVMMGLADKKRKKAAEAASAT
jgi:hypothetical protein